MGRLLATTWFLNVWDVVATVWVTEHGVEEANPVMDWALGLGPGSFAAIKLSLAAVSLACIYRVSRSRTRWHRVVAWALAGAAAALYLGLGLWHGYGIYMTWR